MPSLARIGASAARPPDGTLVVGPYGILTRDVSARMLPEGRIALDLREPRGRIAGT